MDDLFQSQTGAVVIGRDEGERLKRCLSSLQGHVRVLVYVDSGSSDGSVEAAKAAGAEVVELDMRIPFTASRARAEGLRRLEARVPAINFVMFADGDCEVEKGWLATASHFLETNEGYAVACGRRRERDPAASRYNQLADREWDTPLGDAAACGGDAMMRIVALRQVGGFDPAMIAGEEPELCRRLRQAGWKIMRLNAPMTIHDAAMMRFGQWWLRAVRSGFGYAQAWDRTRQQGSLEPLYRRELARAAAWAGALPFLSVLLAISIHPALLLVWPAAVLAQYLRMARREGRAAASLSVAGKYAEFAGALRYVSRLVRGETGGTIVYK